MTCAHVFPDEFIFLIFVIIETKTFNFTIHNLIKICMTLTVTNSRPEKSFTSIRLIKTLLRTKMLRERLTGLPLMCIHHGIKRYIRMILQNQK